MLSALQQVSGLYRRAQLWRCVWVGDGVKVRGRVVVHGPGRVSVGHRVFFDGRELPIELFAGPGAELHIGDGCVLEPGVSLEAHRRVVVGARCHLGRLAKVMDNHFHAVSGDRLTSVEAVPVTLAEEVTLGERSIVLPGALLERGVTLLEGTVVSRRVRAGTTLMGSPARAVEKG